MFQPNFLKAYIIVLTIFLQFEPFSAGLMDGKQLSCGTNFQNYPDRTVKNILSTFKRLVQQKFTYIFLLFANCQNQVFAQKCSYEKSSKYVLGKTNFDAKVRS